MFRNSKLYTLILLFVAFQNISPQHLVGRLGRYLQSIQIVAVSGNYAYLTNNNLNVFNITNPALPILVTSFGLSATAQDIVLSGNKAYIAVSSSLQIIDISNPASPSLIGGVTLSGTAVALSISGNYAYIANNSGLQIIDISNPVSPSLAGSLSALAVRDVAVQGKYAYLAGDNGIQAIDISNPLSPSLAANLENFQEGNSIQSIAVDSNFLYATLYVASGVIPPISVTYEFLKFNISNPTSPLLEARYDSIGQGGNITVYGDHVFAADGAKLWIIGSDGSANTYNTGGARNVFVSGNYAYVADYYNCLQIIDISNAAVPVFSGGYSTNGTSMNISVSNNYAYVADGAGGLKIVDISNPASPFIAVIYKNQGYVYNVVTSGNYAFSGGGSNLHIIDISNPLSPLLVGKCSTPGPALGIAVSGKYVYVAAGYAGLQVIDIGNLSSPVITGAYNTPTYARDVAVSGNYAYVADDYYTAGLQIIDISNPVSPTLAGTRNTSGNTYAVTSSPDFVFGLDYGGAVYIWSGNPSSKTLVGSYGRSVSTGNGFDITLSGHHIFRANGYGGLQIFDISNPATPALAGTYSTSGDAYGVAVSGDYIYICEWGTVLEILEFDPLKIAPHEGIKGLNEKNILSQNYPNPFNATTTIQYDIPNMENKDYFVTLSVFNNKGQLVRTLVNQNKQYGHYLVTWDGKNNFGKKTPAGVYACQLKIGTLFKEENKLILNK